MPPFPVIVTAAPLDLYARGIAAGVLAQAATMTLVAGRALAFEEAEVRLESIPESQPCAVIVVAAQREAAEVGARLKRRRPRAVIVQLTGDGDLVLQRVGLDEVFDKLSALVSMAYPADLASVAGRPLLSAALGWIHEVIRDAIDRRPEDDRDIPGISLAPETVATSLKAREAGAAARITEAVRAADETLARALNEALVAPAQARDPLAAAHTAFGLTNVEFRIVLLALAPELDVRYQVGLGMLLNNLGCRVGTLGLFCAWLGEPSQVRHLLNASRNLARWRLVDGPSGGLPAADEPFRLDSRFAAWLLGDASALGYDPRLRSALRLVEWPGWQLLESAGEGDRSRAHVAAFNDGARAQWRIFTGNPAYWRAALELGAGAPGRRPLRLDASRAIANEMLEETGRIAGRAARLTALPLVVDASDVPAEPGADEALRLLLASITKSGVRGAIVAAEPTRITRLLGAASFELADDGRDLAVRAAAFGAAARDLGFQLDPDEARDISRQFPLAVDGIEQAMRTARERGARAGAPGARERLVAACRDAAAEGTSRFADRIEPAFELNDVVLPSDRKRQLQEIVDSVRYSGAVLDGWKFREQLPYGRGTTALFHGPSGTGKTMSALAVAKALGIERRNGARPGEGRYTGVTVLRVELSRLVSKFIGDTPKHIDAVFEDARRSGCAILIDEADALLSRRTTEAKDSNDRHSAMEVAYLLQRIENLHDDGLVILTTNLRQNIDPAFMRRLRFVVEFPRPDAVAREKIWRRCLPPGSHTLDEAAFRQLARKIDLTGGHIRQITLRAAFAAAAAHRRITLADMAYASRAELAKLGMPAANLDVPELKAA